MLAGLLKQPRSWGKEAAVGEKEEDPRVLRKRIAELEKETREQHELIELLKSLPSVRGKLPELTQARAVAKSRRRRKGEVHGGGEGASGGGAAETGEAPPR
jgi:hypothetical protein